MREEAALARSMYIQFADKAVLDVDILTQTFQTYCGRGPRWLVIWRDLFKVVRQNTSFLNLPVIPHRYLI